jgi:hypothetical protein
VGSKIDQSDSPVGFDICIGQLDRRQPLGGGIPDVSRYLDIAQDFCPYIRPAIEAGALFQSQYSLAALRALSTDERAAEGLLYVGVIHTEWLRLRRMQSDPKTRRLICDTIVISEDDELSFEQLASVVMWPHWILKYLYSGVGIMFANFWRGYESYASDGRYIPTPPKTLVAIRSAVPERDPRFLGNDAAIAAFIKDSSDDGQNIHRAIAPIEIAAPLSAAALRDLRYFDRARLWSRALLPEVVRLRLAEVKTSGRP